MYYILEGPANCGNVFGHYSEGLIPNGKFAVVKDGEYINGGYGPISVDGKVWKSKKNAEKALKDALSEQPE